MKQVPQQSPEGSPEERPVGPHRGATAVVAILTAIGIAVAVAIEKAQSVQQTVLPPAPTNSATPIAPAIPQPNPDYHTDNAKVQTLVDELNKLLKNQRGTDEFYPLFDTHSQSVILFLAGDKGLITPPEEGGLEGYMQTHPTLRRLALPITARSIVVTDGTRRSDNSEVRFDACLDIDVRGKTFRIVHDPKAYSEIPQDRLVSGYKIFEVQGQNLHLVLEVIHNEHVNPQLARFVGTMNEQTIDQPFVLEQDFGGGLDKVAGAVIPLLAR